MLFQGNKDALFIHLANHRHRTNGTVSVFNLRFRYLLAQISYYYYKPMFIDIFFSISSYLYSFKYAYSYIIWNNLKNKHTAKHIKI
jgi:hypothetical protein